MDRFHKNLAKWALLNPEESEAIGRLDLLSPLSVSFNTAANDMPNLKMINPQGVSHFHSTEDPLEEAKNWFASLYLQQIQVIYIYGIGLGYYYEAAKNWLKEDKNRYLVFIEDDPEVMRRFLETERCTEMLDNPQVYIRLIGTRDEQIVQFTEMTSLFSSLNSLFSSLKYYLETKPVLCSQFKSTISFLTTMHRFIYGEVAGHGMAFFRNFYLNYFNISRSLFANGLLGQFKGVPAIICGAGPSLDKNIDVLSTLTDRAIIFAGGTALNALNGKGVMPHFGVGIDPNPDQFTRLVMNHAFELPFIYRCRMRHEALEMVHGNRLYLTGSGGYAVGKWFEQQLGVDEEELKEGFNVLNFSVVIAHAMGCNPIICAGIDLAYSGGESYASGVVSHPVHSRKSHFKTKKFEDEVVTKPDIYGKSVDTQWKWLAESLWYTHFAEEHPECAIINATEGGIGFLKIENMTLEEVKKRYLSKQLDLKTRLHGEIQNHPLPPKFNDPEIISLIDSIQDHLSKCAEKCQHLLRLFSEIAQQPSNEEKYQEEIAHEEKELFNEPIYDVVLKRFNEDYLKHNDLDFKRLEGDKVLLPKEDYIRAKAMLEFNRFRFLLDTSQFNVEVIKALLQTHQKKNEQNQANGVEKDKTAEALRQKYPIPVPKEGEEYVFDEKKYQIKDPGLNIDYSETFSEGQRVLQENLFYPSGQLKLETHYLNDVLHGPSTYYAENGKILSQAWFVNGKQEGKMWSYHPDGSLHSLQMFKNGEPIGVQQYFYPNGQPKSILPYKQDGVLHGEVNLFYPNATPARQLTFLEGKRNGLERIWNGDGQLLIESQYDAGRPVGRSRLWHWNGVLAKEIIYDDDFVQIVAKEWDKNGALVENQEIDYFDQIDVETHHLTDSLNRMVQEMTALTPMMTGKIQTTPPPSTKSTLAEDMAKLQKEMQYLQALDGLLKEQLAPGSEGKEAIWKTQDSQRALERQFEGVKDKINIELGEIGKGIQKIMEKLLENKDDSSKQNPSS